jgi:cytochrome c oxidase cbb3-type subunit 1
VLYIASMWIAGVMQGLMWRATGEDGMLTYSFVEVVKSTYPFYLIRMLGGLFFLSGMCLMAWNTWLTVRGQERVNPLVPLDSHDARAPQPAVPASA